MPSGGSLNIPTIDKHGGYTTDTFDLTSAGRWAGGEFKGTVTKLKLIQF